MILGLGNILQTIPDDAFQQLFASACLTDENGDIILQEDGVSCLTMENVAGGLLIPDIEGIPSILGGMKEGDTLTATSASIIGNPTPAITWQWESSTDVLLPTEYFNSPNDFSDTSAWLQGSTTRVGGQAGWDETNNAWELTRSSGGSVLLTSDVFANGIHTFKIRAKVNPNNGIGLAFGGAFKMASFNISDRLQTAPASEEGGVIGSCRYIGGDWYELSAYVDADNVQPRLYVLNADGTETDGNGAVFTLQDAELKKPSENWTNISGATSSTYTLQSSDVGNYLRVVQTATNSEGSDVEYSQATSQVIPIQTPQEIAAAAFQTRVLSDGGTLESIECLETDLTFLMQNP